MDQKTIVYLHMAFYAAERKKELLSFATEFLKHAVPISQEHCPLFPQVVKLKHDNSQHNNSRQELINQNHINFLSN